MRALVVIATLASLGSLARTAGAVDRKCYAGTETVDGKSYAIVSAREADRAASELRVHTWSAREPWREAVTVYHIAADGKTFTFGQPKLAGTGTLEGPAWAWTAYHAEGSAMTGITVVADGKLSGDTLTVTTSVAKAGKTLLTGKLEARTFDCAELAHRRAALDDTAPDAKRSCYAGKLADTLRPQPHAAVLEQIVETKRIRVIRWIEGTGAALAQDLAIDGTTITVTEPGRTAVHGSGTLQGTPGAWTGYTWTAQLAVLKDQPPLAITAEGTLGGARATMKMSSRGKHSFDTTFEGTAFDCKDLDARTTALAPAR